MSVVFWVMVLIVKGRIAGRSVHHAGLSVHHVAHRRIRTVCPAWSCGQWWKHYTLLRLDLCSVIGRRVLDKLAVTPSKVLEELETSMPTRYSVSSSQRGRTREIERHTYRGATTSCVMRFAKVTIASLIISETYVVSSECSLRAFSAKSSASYFNTLKKEKTE